MERKMCIFGVAKYCKLQPVKKHFDFNYVSSQFSLYISDSQK